MDEKIFIDILESREARRDKQLKLINRYNNSLISFTLNIPGMIKDSEIYRNIHKEGIKAIIKTLDDQAINILYNEEIHKNTGSEGYIVVDMDAMDLKKVIVDIEENHPLGRIFDIDIFDFNHKQLSRKDLGSNPRRCLLCDNDATVCMRSKSHTYEELIQRIHDIWKEYENRIE